MAASMIGQPMRKLYCDDFHNMELNEYGVFIPGYKGSITFESIFFTEEKNLIVEFWKRFVRAEKNKKNMCRVLLSFEEFKRFVTNPAFLFATEKHFAIFNRDDPLQKDNILQLKAILEKTSNKSVFKRMIYACNDALQKFEVSAPIEKLPPPAVPDKEVEEDGWVLQ